MNQINQNKEMLMMEMYEVCWQEIKATGLIVTKRKAFKTEKALNKFIEKLFDNDRFYRILATR